MSLLALPAYPGLMGGLYTKPHPQINSIWSLSGVYLEFMEFMWSISEATATIFWSLYGLHLDYDEPVEFYLNTLNTPALSELHSI